MGILLFLFLLAIVGIVYLLWPIIRLFLAFSNTSRRTRQAFNDAQRQARQRGGYRQPDTPKRHRKIFDQSVGEYVDFEEISTFESSTTSDGTQQVKYTREEQIVDVEWEDIK